MRRISSGLSWLFLLPLCMPCVAANPRTDALPRTEGQIEVAGLASRVLIDRDDLGIPSISGESLLDVVRAQGFLHGQERFVQMDMTRRLAAGELAALVGPLMLDADRKYRAYRFRSVARRVINRMRPDHRELLRAYTEGVNEGLDDLEALPLEYQFLQSNPQVWKEEDSILVMLMMYDMLQGSARMEGMLGVMREALPEALFTFLTPLRTRFDVPILPDRTRKESSSYKPVAIPGPDVIDVRRRVGNNDQDEAERLVDAKRIDVGPHEMSLGLVDVSEIVIGSNNWAVAGQRSLHGGAILANDMHLALTSPGIWYRAEMNWPNRSVSGLTLPGLPGLITGSNGDVAWGFTNTEGDFQDLIIIEVHPENPDLYRTSDGWRPFEKIIETIKVRGRKAVKLTLRSTMWGIVTSHDYKGRPLVMRWVALMPEAINLNLLDLLEVESLDEAMMTARNLGMPSQNILFADRAGRIGWIVSGYLPQRQGFRGMFSQSWADGTIGWNGKLSEKLRPSLVDPAGGILFTANNRTVDNDNSLLIGHAWASGYRAQRIAELLDSQGLFDERDLLDMQLDTRTKVFDFYRDLILETTPGPPGLPGTPRAFDTRLVKVRAIVKSWNGTADIDQPALRLLAAFRRTVHAKLFAPLIQECRRLDENFRYRWSFSEEIVRRILEERPAHLLAKQYADWSAFINSAFLDTLDDLARRNPDISLQTPWGKTNRASIGHPMSDLMPQMATALRMPDDPLPGHWSAVRMATPRFGASARMVVSPGREAFGILHMPSGQSGDPLSPHFRDGHDAWVRGLPTSFLPGESVSTLTLVPANRGGGN